MNYLDQNSQFMKNIQNFFVQSQMMNHVQISPPMSVLYSPLSSSTTSFGSPIKTEWCDQEEPLNLSVKESNIYPTNNHSLFVPPMPFFLPPMFQAMFPRPLMFNQNKFDHNILKQFPNNSDQDFKRRRALPLKMKKSRSFKCNQCRNIFGCLSTLSEHTQKEHGGYKCHICETSFTQRSNLQRHALRHVGFKPYKCNVCAKEYYRKDHLIRHISFNHPTVNPKENIIQRLSSSESLNFIDSQNDVDDVSSLVKEEPYSPHFVHTSHNSLLYCDTSNEGDCEESSGTENVFLSKMFDVKEEMCVDVLN